MPELNLALEQLRLKLLDLTGRNRLIRFRHSPGKSLQFCEGDPARVYEKLVESSSKIPIVGLPEPRRDQWVEQHGRRQRPDPLEWARLHQIPTSYDLPPGGTATDLRALFYPEDLAKHCRKLEREANLAIEETGANMLFLVLGFLEHPDQQHNDSSFLAPLISVPVAFSKRDVNGQQVFSLQYTGDEIAENLSLREKLRADHGLVLPEFNDEDFEVDAYLNQIQTIVRSRPGFAVRRRTSLCLLSFTNMLLFRDLDPKHWGERGEDNALLQHPIVQQVLSGTQRENDGNLFAPHPEHAIESLPAANIPLIYDADSSQHSALVDALVEKQNLVIEGPPGTGKSQTITNLIAACLSEGKTVLFVAEKMAALEVVRNRLTRAKLDPFVLELHSNKTSKKQVLETIERRLKHRDASRADLQNALREVEAYRAALQRYADLINRAAYNELGLTLHGVIWRSEQHRLSLSCDPAPLTQVRVADATTIGDLELTRRRDCLKNLGLHFAEAGGDAGPNSPFFGFLPHPIYPETEHSLRALFARAAEWSENLEAAAQAEAALLGGGARGWTTLSAEQEQAALQGFVATVDPSLPLHLLPVLFRGDNTGQSSHATLVHLRRQLDRHRELASHVAEAFADESVLSADRLQGLHELANAAAIAGCTLGTVADLQRSREALESAHSALSEGLAAIRGFCAAEGLVFEPTRDFIGGVAELLEIVRSAPDSILDLQLPGLAGSGASRMLDDLASAQSSWRELQDALASILYVDPLPASDQLAAAIQTLREGPSWYRIFQARWRAAVRFHKTLQRAKARMRAPERLQQLERLAEVVAAKAKWSSMPAWRQVLDREPPDAPVDLGPYMELARWNRAARAAQERLGATLFIPEQLTSDRLRDLRRRCSAVAPAVDRTVRALTTLDSVAPALAQATSGTLEQGVPRIEQLAAIITSQEQWLERYARPDATVETCRRACAAAVERSRIAAAINADRVLRGLLGTEFKGTNTDVDSVIAVHGVGRSVDALPIHPEIKSKLRSCHPLEAASAAIEVLRNLSAGLRRVDSLSSELSLYGHLDLEKFAGAMPGADVHAFATGLRHRLVAAERHTSQLVPWSKYVSVRAEAVELGLGDFVGLLESKRVAPEQMSDAYAYCAYSSILRAAFQAEPELGRFSGLTHERIREEFRRLDRKVIELRGAEIASRQLRLTRPPQGENGARVADKTEMCLINYLLPQQRPRVPVRRMLERAGRAIQALKPCFMMGPQAVAQFLTPGALDFDVVIMDEASQLRSEEAVGAIARGTQLVVVGDPKQLPPTSFFSRDGAQGNDGQPFASSDAESILDLCASHFKRSRRLRWHYRSQHHSLIAFSNVQFYDSDLIVFPSPFGQSSRLGIRATYLADAVYEDQLNKKEAQRVVEAVAEHIQTRGDSSLGVVTLNIKQRDLIAELLEQRLREVPEADGFRERWAKNGQPLFVKNLENVQGDERDAIIISTTFGKAPGTGVVRQNFGPISRDGGWRRLNVLFTRARQSISVYTSLRPEDIVVDGTTPLGTKALRNYLEYARTGHLAVPKETGAEPDSDFERAVIRVLQQRGYDVTPQLGVAGYRIDVAVKHPDAHGVYLAAIECDGATYHSAATVRDRDRIRQEVLESLGWRGRIWRIWSTDWFRAPHAETAKLLSFLDGLRRTWRPEHAAVASWTEEGAATPEVEADVTELLANAALPVEDREVEVGDLVRYCNVNNPDDVLSVRIVRESTRAQDGVIAAGVPLAQALLGAFVGDEVELHVPGAPRRTFRILEIQRPDSES